MHRELHSLAWTPYFELWKMAFFEGNRTKICKNQNEFLSSCCDCMVFLRHFWFPRKTVLTLLTTSAGSILSSMFAIFLSFLHVGWTRTFFRVSKYFVVIQLWPRKMTQFKFADWITAAECRLVTFNYSPSNTLTAYFVDFFVFSGTAFATSYFIWPSLDSIKRVCLFSMEIK